MYLIFNCISKPQGRHREVGSEGSGTANPRADEQKSRIRPRIRVSLPRKAKPTEDEFRVNAAVAGRKMGGLPAEISAVGARGNPRALETAMSQANAEKSTTALIFTRRPPVKDRTQMGNAGSPTCRSTMTQRGVESTRSGESLIPKGVDLLELMLSRENMTAAWKRVKANKGAAGVDGLSIADVYLTIHQTWGGIKRGIEEGTYRPSPVLRTFIPKGNGETRPLGIPTVMDRLIQQALAQVLVQIFDPSFSTQSYGFRPNRSAHGAVQFIASKIKSGM